MGDSNFHLILTNDEVVRGMEALRGAIPDGVDLEWSEGPDGSVVFTVSRRSPGMQALLDQITEGALAHVSSHVEHAGLPGA